MFKMWLCTNVKNVGWLYVGNGIVISLTVPDFMSVFYVGDVMSVPSGIIKSLTVPNQSMIL